MFVSAFQVGRELLSSTRSDLPQALEGRSPKERRERRRGESFCSNRVGGSSGHSAGALNPRSARWNLPLALPQQLSTWPSRGGVGNSSSFRSLSRLYLVFYSTSTRGLESGQDDCSTAIQLSPPSRLLERTARRIIEVVSTSISSRAQSRPFLGRRKLILYVPPYRLL